MFKPHYGDCKSCDRTDALIPVKSGDCQYCNHEKKQRAKGNKGNGKGLNKSVSRNTFNVRKKPTGEREVFEEIAAEREWRCFVTGNMLHELTATQFMHVLPKALNKYPLFKLYKPNIQLASNDIHFLWDHTPRSDLKKDERFNKLFQLENKLMEEYNELKKYKT